MDLGELLTRWSVRFAVACYLARVFLDLSSAGSGLASNARWFWTMGCALNVLHVICAFSFYHGWSHLAAYHQTAEKTGRVIGIGWGGGLYFNYFFTVLWVADVAAWWLGGVDFPYRSPGYFCTLHAIFAFMMVNATIVFGPPAWRSGAPVVGLVLLVALFLRRRRRSKATP